ncbi:MAG: alpha/beta hydrolase [Candidatus Saccharibacteria bacterium]|nr:alpha/beta hydrolase [Candidatus Saccharibacteria bacterium]
MSGSVAAYAASLSREFLMVRGSRVAVYVAPEDGRPVALLVHGFSGSYGGMTYLAEELRDVFRVVLIDMPSHGATDYMTFRDGDDIVAYMRAVAGAVSERYGTVSWLVGHSMGAGIVSMMQPALPGARLAFICPVPTPSRVYDASIRLMQRSVMMRWLQGVQLLAVPRGMALLKCWRGGGFRRMCDNAVRYGAASWRQMNERANMPSLVIANRQFRGVAVDLVIAGRSDATAKERTAAELEAAFPSATIHMLPGGHLLPIESPAAVAAVFLRYNDDILNT